MKLTLITYLLAACCTTIVPLVSALPRDTNNDTTIRAATTPHPGHPNIPLPRDANRLPPKLWCGDIPNTKLCITAPYNYSCSFDNYTVVHNGPSTLPVCSKCYCRPTLIGPYPLLPPTARDADPVAVAIPENNLLPREPTKLVNHPIPVTKTDHLWAAICHQDFQHTCTQALRGACDETGALHRLLRTSAGFEHKRAFAADSACNSRCHCFHLETSQRVQKRYIAPRDADGAGVGGTLESSE